MGSKVSSIAPVVCDSVIISDGLELSVNVGGAWLKVSGATASETFVAFRGRCEEGIGVGCEGGDDYLEEQPRADGSDEPASDGARDLDR